MEELNKTPYEIIKSRVIQREFPNGERLQIEKIAEDLRLSVTPVREILNRLVCENLVFAIPKVGFFMKSLSELELRNLYEYNYSFLEYILRTKDHSSFWRYEGVNESKRYSCRYDKEKIDSLLPDAFVEFTETLFFEISLSSHNQEFERTITNLNNRLHFVRLKELDILQDVRHDLANMYESFIKGDNKELSKNIFRYHKKRWQLVPDIVAICVKSEG